MMLGRAGKQLLKERRPFLAKTPDMLPVLRKKSVLWTLAVKGWSLSKKASCLLLQANILLRGLSWRHCDHVRDD